MDAATPKNISAIKSIPDNNGFAIYPNPANDNVHVAVNGTLNSVIIRNLNGQVVFQNLSYGQSGSMDISLVNIPPGMYFLSATTKQGVSTAKLIKN